jgi:hypothetical protein
MTRHHEHEGVAPRLTEEEIAQLRPATLEDGRQRFPQLPPLISNSLLGFEDPTRICTECRESPYFDRQGYTRNRLLGKALAAALDFFKPRDKDGPLWVLEWRLYPLKEHPRFREIDGCSCGCGCDSLGHHHHGAGS